jgi:hypothetical protein
MRHIILILLLALPLLASAQFAPKGGDGENLTVIVTDGTFKAHDSPQRPPSDAKYTDPIRPLGMVEALQAGAFLEAPKYGKAGFILIFCVNDSVGGKQGTLERNGTVYKGVYRLIRQRMSINEAVPEGMTTYKLEGTVFFLGIS